MFNLGNTWMVKSIFSKVKCFSKRITNDNYSLQSHPRHINVAPALNFSLNTIANGDQKRIKTVKLAFDSYESTKDAAFPSLPIVVKHGLLGSKTNWRTLCKDIAKKTRRKIYAVDARNHGESPHSENCNYFDMAADLENFLKQMEISKSILIGHSMGGRVAMTVALNKPELVDKLVIVDVSPVSKPDAADANIIKYIEAMLSSLKEIPVGTSLSQARLIIDKLLSPVVPSIVIRQFLLTNLMEINNKIAWRCNLEVLLRMCKERILEFSLKSGWYDGETLFICGNNSPFVPKSDHEKIKKIFPNSRFTYVEAGHWVHAEKPTEFIQILTEFIQS